MNFWTRFARGLAGGGAVTAAVFFIGRRRQRRAIECQRQMKAADEYRRMVHEDAAAAKGKS